MTKELSKSIMDRSSVKNRYLKWSCRKNFLAHKKAKNLCNSLNKKEKKTYFEKATENGIMGTKTFWSKAKPFLSSKGIIHNNDIAIKLTIKSLKISLNQLKHLIRINIVEGTTDNHPTKFETLASRISDKEIVETIIDKFKNHPSITSIKNEFRPTA